MSKKQTAVEWLVEQLIPKASATYDTTTCNAIEKAKAMEKEQIKDAYIEASANLEDITKGAAEQYYTETYEQ